MGRISGCARQIDSEFETNLIEQKCHSSLVHLSGCHANFAPTWNSGLPELNAESGFLSSGGPLIVDVDGLPYLVQN